MAHKLIQLDRTFLDVSERDEGVDPASLSVLASVLRKTIHWSVLGVC